jgi:hypothetical protein
VAAGNLTQRFATTSAFTLYQGTTARLAIDDSGNISATGTTITLAGPLTTTATTTLATLGGNVGIGTTTPDSTLEVDGVVAIGGNQTSGEGMLQVKQSLADPIASFEQTVNSYWATIDFRRAGKHYGAIGLSPVGTFGSNALVLATNPDGADGNWRDPLVIESGASTGAFYITSNNNVGIGTTAPVSALEVWRGTESKLTITSTSSDSVIAFRTGATPATQALIGIDQSDLNKLKIVRGSDISTSTGITIDSSGNVGIGTTAPQQKLTLASGSNFAVEMAAPTGLSTATTTGGTLPAGTYYFKVVASDGVGTTAGSTEVSQTIAAGEAIVISWSAVTGANSYRVYGNASGAQDHYFTTTDTSYTYTTSTGATAGTVPTVTTAYVQKLTASGDSWLLGGNVGIGTTEPSSRLTIAAGAANGALAIGDFNAKVIDDMEDITDWTSSDSGTTTVSLESSAVKVGAGSLKITTIVSDSTNDTVSKTISNEDWSGYERLGFWIQALYTTTSTDATTSQIISIQFHNSSPAATSTHNITIQEFGEWQGHRLYNQCHLG